MAIRWSWIGVALLLMGFVTGCRMLPSTTFRMTDPEGRAMPGVVTITSSDNVELLFVSDGVGIVARDDGNTPHSMTLTTDEDGYVRISWSPPQRAGFFARLFGCAPTDNPGWISLVYSTEDGARFVLEQDVHAW